MSTQLKPTAVVNFDVSFGKQIVVNTVWTGVTLDRPCTGGWSVGNNAKLAKRLAAAIEAGVVYENVRLATDINGKTYVACDAKVLGRTLNADLKRLGF